jgi:hypothetical protein
VVFLLMNLAAVAPGGRERAKRTVCLANLKQLTAACNLYADDNDSKLPLPKTASYWLQVVEVKTVNFMLRTGLTRKIFYCPSNATHKKYNDLFWLFNNNSWDGKEFTNETGFIVSGYAYIMELAPPANPRPAIRAYSKDVEKKIWLKTNRETSPASRELCVDLIMGIPQTGTEYGRNFAQIPGGIYQQSQVYDRTNHLKVNDKPSGGNIGFLDSHGEWRIFDPDIQNGVAVPRYGMAIAPGFFW